MKQIQLTQGQFALVDDCDHEYLSQFKWCAAKYRGKFYAVRGRPSVRMHRVVAERAGMKIEDLEVDHDDHNGLNNVRSNLRPATTSQNQWNRALQKDNTSGFKGVCWHQRSRKWQARIRVNGKLVYLGYHDDKIDAARAYNEAAIKYFGEFAYLNEVPS